jgi:hypothetical protein
MLAMQLCLDGERKEGRKEVKKELCKRPSFLLPRNMAASADIMRQ